MLIFLPVLLAHVRAVGPVVARVLAFLSFGLAASATYIVNDLLDLEADRHHPRKRRRPFAAGDLSPIAGVATVVVFAGVVAGDCAAAAACAGGAVAGVSR